MFLLSSILGQIFDWEWSKWIVQAKYFGKLQIHQKKPFFFKKQAVSRLRQVIFNLRAKNGCLGNETPPIPPTFLVRQASRHLVVIGFWSKSYLRPPEVGQNQPFRPFFAIFLLFFFQVFSYIMTLLTLTPSFLAWNLLEIENFAQFDAQGPSIDILQPPIGSKLTLKGSKLTQKSPDLGLKGKFS